MASAVCAQIALPVAAAKTVQKPARVSGLARIQLEKAASNTWAQRTVSNGVSTTAMLVWEPTDNKYFETFSYLPPLTEDQIAKQIDYIVNNGWIPCLEFSEPHLAYVSSVSGERINQISGYYDNRYWTMYKLPMFGCTDPSQVLGEIGNCNKSFPNAYVRLTAFDNVRQVQICSFLVHRPSSAKDFRAPEDRST